MLVADDAYDLVVIGAGAIGTVTAWLAHIVHPDWKLLLVDQGEPGSGSTGLTGGLVVPLASSPGHAELVRSGERHWLELARTFPDAVTLLPLMVVVSRAGRGEFDQGTVGSVLPTATVGELRKLKESYPDLVIGDHELVLSAAGRAWLVNGRALAGNIVRWLNAREPCSFWPGSEVVEVVGGAVGGEVTFRSNRTVRARYVVEATGPWRVPHPLLSVDTAETQVKRIVALHLHATVRTNTPAVLFDADDLYILPLAGHQTLLVSFYRDVWLDATASWPQTVTEADLAAGSSALRKRSKTLSRSVVGGRTYVDAYAPARLPIIRQDGWKGGLVVGAGSGSGVRLAPGMAHRALHLLGVSDD